MIPTARPLGPIPARAATRRATVAVLISVSLGLGAGVAVSIGRLVDGRADQSSVLVVVEDEGGGERRADSILLVTWWRQCDALGVTSIPRDLILDDDGESATVLYETLGAVQLAEQLGDRLNVRVGAIASIDLDGVARVSTTLGPVTVDFQRESLDRRTGFHAGPGPVDLVGEDAVAFLRSRAWEEQIDGTWEMTTSSDLARIKRAQDFALAALERLDSTTAAGRARLGEALILNTRVDVVDAFALTGFIAGSRSHRHVSLATLEVVQERAIVDRRSPFAPNDLGATHRLVLADSATLPSACEGPST